MAMDARWTRWEGRGCVALLCVVLAGCSSDSPSGPPDGAPAADAGPPDGAPVADASPPDARPRPARLLGVVLTPAENDATGPFDQANEGAFDQARRVGVNAVQLRWQWGELEPAPMLYRDAELDAANRLFAGKGVRILLGIDPIDGSLGGRGTPPELEGTSFDDPALITRYEQLLDHVLSRIPDLDVAVLMVGNEVNAHLVETNEWQPYATFYAAVGDHARAVAPGLRVGVTGNGELVTDPIQRDPMKMLNQSSDIISLTQWVSTDVHDYFDLLTSEYPGRPISITEIGFPSSPVLGSSEAHQAFFVRDVFSAWDEHSTQIEHISFFDLHDMSAEEAQGWEDLICQQLPEECGDPGVIAALLSSLGLRTYPGGGTDKLAFTALGEEASARGW